MSKVRVPARIGLLGNPSDGYGGRVIAATIDDFAATVVAEPAATWDLVAPARHFEARTTADLSAALDLDGLDEGLQLMAAATLRLDRHGPGLGPHRVLFESDIPRQAGLSGSSAVVIGVLRTLAPELDTLDIARLALEAEVDVLGWAAGPQDRVVQAMGGLVDMRFDEPWDPSRYERLDPARLPTCVLAWTDEPGEHSGQIHASVRDRWNAGERPVIDAMSRFAALAAEGRRSLDDGSAPEAWPGLAEEAFAAGGRSTGDDHSRPGLCR
ncbi:MAG: hypothetical protein AAF480_18270 [Actinomycetota bacterium]